MKIRARSALPLLCLAIAACVSLPYRNPPGRDVAEIIFHNEADAVATAEIFGRAEACKKRRVTGPIAPGGAMSARLPAGRPVSFSLGYKGAGAGGPYCRVYATFSPALHAQYAAFIRPGPEGCRLELRRHADLAAGADERVEFRRREPAPHPLTEYSRFCR